MSHPLVVHCRKQAYDVLCDRTTKWGNPYRGPRAIAKFRRYLARRPDLARSLHTLRGKRLGCWCAPKPCHCDTLAILANLQPLVVLITGDREWTQASPIIRCLAFLPRGSLVIHGAAPGTDTLSGRIAKAFKLQVISYPAQWHRYGRAAGPIRNQRMLDRHPNISLAFAFHDRLLHSKGTKDMIARLVKANIKHVIVQNRIWIRRTR